MDDSAHEDLSEEFGDIFFPDCFGFPRMNEETRKIRNVNVG